MGFFILSASSDSPLRLNASKSSYLFSSALFFLPCENQFKDFLVCCYKSLLISVLILRVARNSHHWAGNTAFPALSVPWNIRFLRTRLFESCALAGIWQKGTNWEQMTALLLSTTADFPDLNYAEWLKASHSLNYFTIEEKKQSAHD